MPGYRLSMAVYKYLDSSCKVEYKESGMMLVIQGSRQTCSKEKPDIC